MSQMRLNLIDKAYAKMDVTGDGVVNLEDLKKVYDVKQHPEYQNGQLTEEDILKKFLAKFEQNGSQDGVVSIIKTVKLTKNNNNFISQKAIEVQFDHKVFNR